MTSLANETAPRLHVLAVPLAVVCLSLALLATGLATEVYVLVPIAALLFAIGGVPAVRAVRGTR